MSIDATSPSAPAPEEPMPKRDPQREPGRTPWHDPGPPVRKINLPPDSPSPGVPVGPERPDLPPAAI